MAHTSRGAENDRELEGHRLPSSSRLCARGWHAYVEVSRRCCNISYSSTAAVALDVERFDAPAQRERDEVVAHRGDARAQPLALGAEHGDDAAGVVRLVVAGVRAGGRAVDPAALLLGLGEEVGEVA